MKNEIEIGGRAFELPFKFNDQISIVTDANGQDVCSVGGDYVFNWDLNTIGQYIATCLNVVHDPEALHVNILRGAVKLSRANALHIAGAGDYDELKAEVERLKSADDKAMDIIRRAAAGISPEQDVAALVGRNFELEKEVERLRAFKDEVGTIVQRTNQRAVIGRDVEKVYEKHFGEEEND